MKESGLFNESLLGLLVPESKWIKVNNSWTDLRKYSTIFFFLLNAHAKCLHLPNIKKNLFQRVWLIFVFGRRKDLSSPGLPQCRRPRRGLSSPVRRAVTGRMATGMRGTMRTRRPNGIGWISSHRFLWVVFLVGRNSCMGSIRTKFHTCWTGLI